MSKTEQAILNEIATNGYAGVESGYSSTERGKTFGMRRKQAAIRLVEKGLIVLAKSYDRIDPVYERFGGGIAGNRYTTVSEYRAT